MKIHIVLFTMVILNLCTLLPAQQAYHVPRITSAGFHYTGDPWDMEGSYTYYYKDTAPALLDSVYYWAYLNPDGGPNAHVHCNTSLEYLVDRLRITSVLDSTGSGIPDHFVTEIAPNGQVLYSFVGHLHSIGTSSYMNIYYSSNALQPDSVSFFQSSMFEPLIETLIFSYDELGRKQTIRVTRDNEDYMRCINIYGTQNPVPFNLFNPAFDYCHYSLIEPTPIYLCLDRDWLPRITEIYYGDVLSDSIVWSCPHGDPYEVSYSNSGGIYFDEHGNYSGNVGGGSAGPAAWWGGYYWTRNDDLVLVVPNNDPIQPAIPEITCYPNPFRSTISIKLPPKSADTVTIYNVKGQRIRTLSTTQNTIEWNGKNEEGLPTASGIYLVRYGSGSRFSTRKIMKLN